MVALLVLSVFFRCTHLDYKVYWRDEAFTSLRISGFTVADVLQQLFDGHEISKAALQVYQQLHPSKNWMDTVQSLVAEDSQHPPLYYLLARGWVQCFGSSVAAIRSLSALLGVLVLPSLYWLCLELFESALVSELAIALVAVSPFHVLFAQEAREFALWTVTTLLSSALLLRAMRLRRPFWWQLYAIAVGLGLYAFPLSVLVLLGHGLYVAWLEGWRWSKAAIAFFLASLIGALAFLPWLLVMMANATQIHATTDWATVKAKPLLRLLETAFNTSRVFLDVDFNWYNPFTYILPPLLGLLGYALYFLCCHAPLRIKLFILTLAGANVLTLMLLDLLLGGVRSTVPRYLIPYHLGIQLAVAYLLAAKMTQPGQRQQQWQRVTIALVALGIISCTSSWAAESWWHKYDNAYLPPIARMVNQAKQPLLLSDNVSDRSVGNLLSLSHRLNANVKLQLATETAMLPMPDTVSTVFLLRPTDTLLSKLQQDKTHQLTQVYRVIQFWRRDRTADVNIEPAAKAATSRPSPLPAVDSSSAQS